MKIALVNAFYHPDEPGGAERSVRTLARALGDRGHQVCVICLSEHPGVDRVDGIEVHRLPVDNAYLPSSRHSRGRTERLLWHVRDTRNPRAAARVGAALAGFGADLVHTNNLAGLSTSVWREAGRLGLPIVHTTRDFYLLCPRSSMVGRKGPCRVQCLSCRAFAWPRIAESRRVAAVVGISRFVLERHLGLGCFANATQHVIHNAYDAPRPPLRRAVPTLPTIGFIGRLVPEKGVEQLIAAVGRMRERGVAVQLLVAGEGATGYVDRLRKVAGDLPVEFIGRQVPHEFFGRVDLTVVPSIWEEPMGRVVVESYANGRPVVMTPVGGLPELATSDAAIVAAGCDDDALADAVSTMVGRLRNPRQDLLDAAVRSSARFGSAEMAARYEAVYLRTMAGAAAQHPAATVTLDVPEREGS
ncbi:MAG: glycosyltransferase family 4 protein [Zoogloeaceae bacterium]|nr:glycosyltransferase family 4 protein [Rhodocyclaceae bacterium]MCP5238146.1 glycosyltransferase family 4 protein [Zoogloeaceae bacterium]